MPHRVILEANPPRQGFLKNTWDHLNEYMLEHIMTEGEYLEIIECCRKIVFNVYTSNREESNFIEGSRFEWFN